MRIRPSPFDVTTSVEGEVYGFCSRCEIMGNHHTLVGPHQSYCPNCGEVLYWDKYLSEEGNGNEQ